MRLAEDAVLTVSLAGRRVHLQCNDVRVRQHWESMFAGMDRHEPGPAELALRVRLVDELPPPPATAPFFRDRGHAPNAPRANLEAYRAPGGAIQLHFPDGALLSLDADDPLSPAAVITPAIFRFGRIEDVTMAALAAGLRRFGAFVLHAFSATADGRAILLVGASGSGKTTTGLNLLAHGWKYLANDLAVLAGGARGVLALPSPGGFSIRPPTLTVLPALRQAARRLRASPEDGKIHLPATGVIAGWGDPAPVAAILFPTVGRQETSQLRPVSPAVALARLMAESVDRWDEPALAEHVALLEALSHQAPAQALQLGGDFDALPGRLLRLLHDADNGAGPERPER